MKYMKLGSKPNAFQSDGKSIRFVATELETDIIVNVGDVKFYLHKFPLLSKSPHLQRLVASIDEESSAEIDIPDIPGGAAAFEVCAKFCYGMIVTLNAYNVVAARCAAEYLEMHETVEKGNLIYKIDAFLISSIFRSWKDSIIMLQTTKSLQAWSEGLKVVSHCIDSIAVKASIDPEEVEWSYTYNRRKLPSKNGLDPHWNGVMRQQSVPKDWWVEDLCELEMDSYKRVILAIRTKGRVSAEVVGESLKAYAYRRLPGFGKSATHGGDFAKHRTLLESIVWLLPPEAGSVSCSFLLRLLKAGSFLNYGENCKKELIKRIGYQLQDASVADLLIPAPAGESTLYDIDTVLRIVEEFFMQDHSCSRSSPQASGELQEMASPALISGSSKVAVAKLVDSYLAEAAKDPNLPLSKFVELTEMVSGSLRPSYDGLYRAIDMFLEEHPDLTKREKKNICSLMDCSRLSRDACLHAVQNDRLPLRIVVQLLFFEQVRQAGLPTGRAESLLHHENRSASYGSSRSAGTTYAEDEWDRVPAAGDVSSLNTVKLEGKGVTGSERSNGSSAASKNGDGKSGDKVKGVLVPKRILSKPRLSGMVQVENRSSDTSESPGSVNAEEAKSTLQARSAFSFGALVSCEKG